MSDNFWVLLRAILMVAGGFMAGKGYVTMSEFTAFIDKLQTIIPALLSIGAAGWAMWVRYNTRAVPIKTAMRPDVPTVSAATGAIEPGPSKTS